MVDYYTITSLKESQQHLIIFVFIFFCDVNVMTLFTNAIYKFSYKAGVIVPGKPFQPDFEFIWSLPKLIDFQVLDSSVGFWPYQQTVGEARKAL
jgi:hypothetical protein